MKFYIQKARYEEAGDAGDGAAGAGGAGDGVGDPGVAGGDDNSGAGDAGDGAETSWYQSAPDDWRQQIAGEDEAKLKRTERYTDFNQFVNSAFEAHERARQGKVDTGLPQDANDEQLAEYREANGIPVDGKYELDLGDGLELNEFDQEIIGHVMPTVHDLNINSESFNSITKAFVEARDAQGKAMEAQDGIDSQQTQQLLQDTWKGDFQQNMKAVDNLLTRELPSEVKAALVGGRDADGKGLMNNPALLSMFANLERKLNPMSSIPGGAENASDTARSIVDQAKKYQAAGERYPDGFEAKYDKALEYILSIGEKV